jgi:predicted RND superfamily exporter protein
MERIYQTIVEPPWSVLAVLAVATAIFAYHAAQIRMDSSVEALLPEDDPGG